MSGYPEHDKLGIAQPDASVIGDFLEWCGERGYVLYRRQRWDEEVESVDLFDLRKDAPRRTHIVHKDEIVPVRGGIEDHLAEYFDIDQVALDREKREMLAAMREMNKT